MTFNCIIMVRGVKFVLLMTVLSSAEASFRLLQNEGNEKGNPGSTTPSMAPVVPALSSSSPPSMAPVTAAGGTTSLRPTAVSSKVTDSAGDTCSAATTCGACQDALALDPRVCIWDGSACAPQLPDDTPPTTIMCQCEAATTCGECRTAGQELKATSWMCAWGSETCSLVAASDDNTNMVCPEDPMETHKPSSSPVVPGASVETHKPSSSPVVPGASVETNKPSSSPVVPGANVETNQPSSSPVVPGANVETNQPSSSPVVPGANVETNQPSSSPVVAKTNRPSSSPVVAKTNRPSSSPVVAETNRPSSSAVKPVPIVETNPPTPAPKPVPGTSSDQASNGGAVLWLIVLVMMCGCGYLYRKRGATHHLHHGDAPKRFHRSNEYQGVSTADAGEPPSRRDSDEWGWDDDGGDVELAAGSFGSSSYKDQQDKTPPSQKKRLVRRTASKDKEELIQLPTIAKTTPGLSLTRNAPSSGPMASGLTATASPTPQLVTKLGTKTTPLSKKPTAPPPRVPQADDFFAEMGLAAQPTFAKKPASVPAAKPSLYASPSDDDLGGGDEWGDDGDLDDLLDD